jgi:hypothetical protein
MLNLSIHNILEKLLQTIFKRNPILSQEWDST